jgi:hypothetical protein
MLYEFEHTLLRRNVSDIGGLSRQAVSDESSSKSWFRRRLRLSYIVGSLNYLVILFVIAFDGL